MSCAHIVSVLLIYERYDGLEAAASIYRMLLKQRRALRRIVCVAGGPRTAFVGGPWSDLPAEAGERANTLGIRYDSHLPRLDIAAVPVSSFHYHCSYRCSYCTSR